MRADDGGGGGELPRVRDKASEAIRVLTLRLPEESLPARAIGTRSELGHAEIGPYGARDGQGEWPSNKLRSC